MKKKTATAVKKRELPKGYKAIGGFADSWDFEKNPVIEGIWGEVRDVTRTVKRGKKMVKETTQVVAFTDDAIGIINVWKSASLVALFDAAQEGDRVWIQFLGMGKKKPGQNAPRLFSCAIAEGSPRKAKPKAKRRK